MSKYIFCQSFKKFHRAVFSIAHPKYSNFGGIPSCNNVAPVTNLCLGRATTRSHSSQWSKQKVAVET